MAEKDQNEIQIIIMAKGGIGLSLVSLEPPEELLYAFMSNVMIDYQDTSEQTTLDGSVQNLQIDNQLVFAQYPAILYLSPATRQDEYRHLPAVSFTVHKMKTEHDNADIYKHLMVQVKNGHLVDLFYSLLDILVCLLDMFYTINWTRKSNSS